MMITTLGGIAITAAHTIPAASAFVGALIGGTGTFAITWGICSKRAKKAIAEEQESAGK